MEQVSIDLPQDVLDAVDYSFREAQEYLTSGAGLAPFTVTLVDDGMEVADHSADTADDVYRSVRALLTQDMPSGYTLCYDGYVETDDGQMDAIVVEAAARGDAMAYTLAMLYTVDDGAYIFEPDYGYAGKTQQLYPAGTKPVVSGMAVLLDEDRELQEADLQEGQQPAGEDEEAQQADEA